MEEQTYTYKYPRPAVTTDCVVFRLENSILKTLLIERGNEPYKGYWAFPGGFLNMDENAEQGALRELEEETGLKLKHIEEFGTFSTVDRDPRGRVISIAFYGITDLTEVKGGDDAANAQWFPIDEIPPLAFDHDEMLERALARLHKDHQEIFK
ncbi:MAG: NUDIX hydrolase [Bacteroidales bacterium]|nr:NUDIX hydrolase [Bacteroidales bacterium]